MKTHVLLVSKRFPKKSRYSGLKTGFVNKILEREKIHTIRSNYDYWKKKIAEVQEGKAMLSLRTWKDDPYRSPQATFLNLFHHDQVAVQKLECRNDGIYIDGCHFKIDILNQLAKNDGLQILWFMDWFDGVLVPGMEPMAIIHFTNFRYGKST